MAAPTPSSEVIAWFILPNSVPVVVVAGSIFVGGILFGVPMGLSSSFHLRHKCGEGRRLGTISAAEQQ